MKTVAIVLEATLGGTRKHVLDLLTYLPANSVRPIFIYSSKRADKTFLMEIPKIKASGIKCIELPMSNNIYNPLNLLCIFRLVFILNRYQIKTLHLHGAIAGTIGRIASLCCFKLSNVIYSPHGGVLHKIRSESNSGLFRFIEKLLVFRKLRFIAVSSDERNCLIDQLGIPDSRIELIHNGISLNKIEKDRDSLRRQLGFSETDFIVLYPALFLEAKGHLNLFSTLSRMDQPPLLKNVKVVLAGDGPLKEEILEIVTKSSYKNQILFAGFVENIEDYFIISDLVILPSVNEAFGYVLIEALLYNRPVLATSVGGIPDIISHGENGYLYDLTKLEELVMDINRLSLNRNALQALSANSKKILNEKFDVIKNTSSIAALYS